MKKNRRTWLTVLANAVAFFGGSRLWAQEGHSTNLAEELSERNLVSLEDQLVYGLRTFRADQRQWIKQLVQVVEQKKLPRAMVNVVFQWARKRNPSVPFPYFQYAMRVLAKRRGVTLP